MKKKFTILIAAAFMLLTMMAQPGRAWADEASFAPSDFSGQGTSGTGSAISATVSGVTFACNKGYGTTQIRCYFGGSITISSDNTITAISFTFSSSSYTGGLSTSYTDLSTTSWVQTLSSQARITACTVTYTASGGSTPSLSVNPAAVNFGSKAMNPAEPYSETFTVTYGYLSENLTVSVGEGLTGVSVDPQEISKDGDGSRTVTVYYNPTTVSEISGNITVSNTADELSKTVAVSGSSYNPASAVIYERYTGNIVEGDYIIYNTNGAMKNELNNGPRFNNQSVTVNNNQITNPDPSIIWHIAADGDYWTIYNAAVNKYAGGTTSKNQGALLDEVNDHARWIITYQYSNFTIENYGRSQDSSDPANRYLRQNTTASAGWATYGSGTGNVPTLYKKAGATTYSVTYNANGATSGTVPTDNTAYSSGDEVTVLGNTGNLSKAGYIWSGWNTQADGLGTNYTAGNTFEITSNTTLYAKWNAKAITSLSYTGTPTKTEYYSGENFDPTGLTVTATFNDSSSEDVTTSVVWTPSPLTTGTTAVTGTYMGQTINVGGLTVTDAPGSQNNPYTVAQAIANTPSSGNVYIHGIVSSFYNTSIVGDGTNYRYYISDDGTTTTQLLVYKGKGLNQETFTNANDLLVGDEVVIYGTLNTYNNNPQIASGNYLYSWNRPAVTVEAPTFSPAAGTYDEAQNVTLSCATEGSTIYYTTDGTDPTNGSTEYTAAINVENTTTIKAIAYVGEDHSTIASATYTIVALNNISDITEVGATYSVKGTVVATNSRGFVMGDGTGYVYYYKNGDTGKSVGDKVKVSGTTGTYGQIIQFTNSATVTEAETSSYNNTPAATVITAVPDYTTGYHLSTYLEFTGALTKSNSNYFITVGEGQIQISYPTSAQSTALTALDGKTVHVKGYFSGINSSSKFTVMLESAEEVVVPTITLAQYVYNLNADGGDNELPVTYTNMPADPQAEVIFYEANGETPATYNWITATINEGYNIAGHIDVNEGEARSAYFKVKGIDANNNEVYSDLVTIIQAAPAGPSISFETTSMSLIAGGEQNRQLSFDYSGLGDNPAFTINYYEQDGTTPATYDHEWLTATITDDKLNVTAEANDGEARTVYLKVYGVKNENVHAESNLVTITQAEYVVDYATLPFEFDGGKADIETTAGLTQNGLGSDYSSSPKLKFDGTGDWVILKINETPGTLGFDIKGNSFSGGTFTVQTSEDGENYTDLKDYTDLTSTAQSEEFSNLGENVRYIKWIYTEKVNGNVALGNITLAKVLVPVATPTFTPAEGEYTEAQSVTIACATEGATIYYTLDGTDPTTESTGYTAAIPVATTTTIKAIAAKDGMANSAIASATYTINIPAITLNSYSIEAPEAGDSGTLEVTYHNITEVAAEVWFCNAEGTVEAEYDWITASINGANNVTYTINPNNGDARTAYFKVWAYDDNFNEVYSGLVTVAQDAYVQKYTVSFTLNGGDFEPNGDFEDEIVEKEGGIYHLPSATKTGFTFDGWDDGNATYEAGAEYTVSGDVDFTAQWSEVTIGTINFNNTASGTAINSESVTGDDSMGNTWTITTAGTSYFYAGYSYCQVGSGNNPATSITFTMTLPEQKTISAFSAKFGGFNDTDGTVTLKVGDETVGTGSLNASTDVTVNATNTTEVGTVLTVTVTNIAKGVKCYYISYTLSPVQVVPVINPTANPIPYIATTGSIVYTIDNYEAGTMTASSEATWISNIEVEEADEIGEVTFGVTANTSNESRSATVTLTFTYGDPAATVTKDVTVTQNGQPSVTVTPASAEVAFAGGAPEFAVTYESLEITDADDFDFEFYETSTSTTAGDQPSWITNAAITGNTTDGFTLTVTVAANDGAARDAYLKVYAAGSNDYIYSNLVTINQAAFVQLTTYSLVTSVDDIVSGKHYIIASSATDGDAYAMGGQTNNNRSGVAVTIENGQISETEGVYEFVINTHESSSKDVEYYTIYDAATPGYLYAASSSKNYLRTETTLDNNGKWTIAIAAEGSAASVVAQGSNTNNNMKFNSNNSIFSCYASGQSAIYLYVKDNDNNFEYYGMEIIYTEQEIPDGETYTIGDGTVMTVPDGFTNDDPTVLIIEDGGQLIHDNVGVKATVKKNITGYGNNTNGNYYFLVSPLTEEIDPKNIEGMTPETTTENDFDLYQWDSSQQDEEWRNYKVTPFSLVNTTGYLYANKNNVTLNFEGTLLKSDAVVEIELNYEEDDDFGNWNLVGNPFTCNANVSLIDNGAATSMAYYRMNSDGTEFESSTDPITPMEGIFVQTTGTEQKCRFSRIDPEQSAGKGNLNLQVAQVTNSRDAQPATDNAIIRFDGGNALQKFSFRNDNAKLYIPQNGKDYAVVNAEAQGEMPVYFKAAENGTYTIDFSMDNVEFSYLHLIDNKTGMDIDLLDTPSYTFEANRIDYASRFRLVFRAIGNENDSENNDFGFFDANGNFLILGIEGTATLQVMDVTGRTISSETFSGDYSKAINASAGVYMLRLIQGNDVRTQKIVVK